MKAILRFAISLLIFALSVPNEAATLKREKRSLYQTGKMTKAKFNFGADALIGYGNWCGKGGSGHTKDRIDGCCKKHDSCYLNLIEYERWGWCGSASRKFNVYLTAYEWTYHADSKKITCGYNWNDNIFRALCVNELCECDRQFMQCLAPVIHTYNPKLLKWSWGWMRSLLRAAANNPKKMEHVVKVIGLFY